jgi:hypothetical protein
MGVAGLEEEQDRGRAQGDQLDSSEERRLDRVFDVINERYGKFRIVHGLALRRGKSKR